MISVEYLTKKNVLSNNPIMPKNKKRHSVPIYLFFRFWRSKKCMPTLISKAMAPPVIHIKIQNITLPFMIPMMNNIVMAAVHVVSDKMFLVFILSILYDTKYDMST